MAYVGFGKPFKLHTDTSVLGLGAVLYPEQGEVEKLLAMPVDHYPNHNQISHP